MKDEENPSVGKLCEVFKAVVEVSLVGDEDETAFGGGTDGGLAGGAVLRLVPGVHVANRFKVVSVVWCGDNSSCIGGFWSD